MAQMAIPLMETPEQQRILDLEDRLEKEKESHKETKSKLEIAEINLKNTIQCLVLREQASYNEKIQQSDNYEARSELKFQKLESEFDKVNKTFGNYKLESEKKFDDLKEQVSKGQKQEELQKLKKAIKKLEFENARLREELSDSTTETKWFKEYVEKFKETDVEKYKNIQELKETIRQKDCKLDDLEKQLSDAKDQLQKRDLKYEEAVVKLNGMDKLQKAMEDLELKHSQLQHQHQQLQQQLNENVSTHSEELVKCLSLLKKVVDAWFNSELNLYSKLYVKYEGCYKTLSVGDKKICNEMWGEYSADLRKKKMHSQ